MPTLSDQGWIDVSSEVPTEAYTATASQTEFDVPYVFFSDGDLDVYVDDVLKTLTTHYTVTGEEDEDGGTVTFVTAMTGGESVVITREVEYELTTHIPPSGPLDIPAVNLQFAKLVAMIQQFDRDRVRSLHQPDSDATDFIDLPVKADRLGKFLSFNITTGQPQASASVTGAAVSAFMETLLDDTTAAAARTTLGVTDLTSYAAISNWHHCR